MGTSVQVFDSNMDAWKDAQREPWMILRYRLAQANLNRHFGNSALQFDPVFFADLERLEYAMSDKHPYRLIGRFIHLIARREIEESV
jgi:hypothetical protein